MNYGKCTARRNVNALLPALWGPAGAAMSAASPDAQGAAIINAPWGNGVGSLLAWFLPVLGLLLLAALTWKILRLRRRLAHANMALERSSEQQLALSKQLEYLAMHDPLTHVPNRALFQDRLQQAIFAAQRDESMFALILLNLSGFRAINDTFGHSAGDHLLAQVAERLEGKLRKTDTLARLGSDEFVLLVPDIRQPAQAEAKAHNLVMALQQPFMVDGHQIQTGAHMGIALYPAHADTGAGLLRCADLAMETARFGERDYAFFEANRTPATSSRMALQTELRQAIENKRIELYYQPIVDANTGQCTGLEALVRWHHPRLGLLLPQAFVPLAEHSGQILPLTLLTLEQALRNARSWHQEFRDLYLSLNVSPVAIMIPTFFSQVSELLRQQRPADQALELEITGGAVHNLAGTHSTANRLTSLDVTLALDAFNTTHSSVHYLTALPIRRLKIDHPLILSMATNEHDMRLVKSTIRLCKELGLTSIAEGVETGETLNTLRALGCDCVQGTYISPPLPADMVVGWLREAAWNVSRVYA